MISASGGDSMTFYVNFPVPPIADFVADYTEILSGTSVNFTNSSTCGVSYSWNFGDGGTSTAENPSHTYNQTGYFTVVLTATNSYGNNVKTRTNYIHVLPSDALPEAEFTFDVTETCTGYVNFTNTSSNYSNLLWDFGDGNTSTEINPQYRYETNGYFTVTLTATNINGDSVYTSPTQIAVDLPTAPTTTSASVCDAAQLTLTATGTGILKWYDAQEGGNLINTGTSYTNIFASTTTYYVENTISNTILSYNVGRTTRGNNQQSSAPTQQQSPQSGIVFNTLQPVKLVSVQVFASQAANNKIIRLLDANDNILYNTTVNIPYNNTTPVTITFPANWNIPIGTGYKLVVTNSRYLYRTTATTLVQFPYTVTDVISLTGPTPTTNNYYNTFYNWVIQTIPETCQSVRTPVTATIFDSFSVNISGQTSICEGETSTLTASCGVGGTIYYQGTNPNGTSTANMTDNVVVSESGTYYFRAKNAQDCWGQVDSITVTVNPLPAAISISPDNGEFCGSATLTVSGGEGGTIYWQGISENGTSVAIASSEQIVTESGTYYFRAGTSEGCWSEQAETTIIINPLPEISMEENIVVCNFPYILPVPEYFENYSWIDTTAQTINPEINEIGNYFLVVTDENGCSASDIVSVILFTNVLIDISSTSCTNPSANNGTATVNINQITPSNILWSNGETTTTIENLASGIYTVTISNDDGCQIVDSVEVSHLVSIMPNESEIFISVFPNPNAGQFTVELNNNNLEFIKYQIIDVKATVVIEKKIIFKDKISISSNLSAGIYYIKLFSKDKIYTQQFIVE
jgi:PKD repeat protein